MSIPHPLRALRRWRSEFAVEQADILQENLRTLGYSWIVLPFHLRAAVHGYYLWMHRAAIHSFCRFALPCGLALVIALLRHYEQAPPGMSGVFFLLVLLPLFGIGLTENAPGRMRQYRLVGACAAAIGACATVRTSAGSERRRALRAASVTIRSVERAVFRARRTQRTVARGRRFRQAALRQHAGKVVAVLRAAEVRLDANQDAALEELTGLLVRIAASSAGGRLGAMLPESITVLKPVRSYELLRMAAAVALFLGAIVGVSVWEVPDPAAGTVIAGMGLVSAVVAFGPDWRRFISMIELLRG
ncbi:hypothetical protein OG887_36855 [Streptomyces sp. NBC_00053]|uniref:hypothetical protein n=1 Tax=unclassified Streptomyces TaxID=2593676 RepID=UPI0022535811|nr:MULTISPECIES: hypothetical protein [unclassified Streptomyces]MCX5504900.1 hypothetical protein [Streptomyces sp. NBC_00052]MCX5546563.1 hypothetical protein [Streptomyces sp. NBC_00051]